MPADLHIRRGTPDDANAFCGLFNGLYRRKVDAGYYHWRFFSAPFPTDLWVATATDDGPIGFYGVHHFPASDGVCVVSFAVDIMVRPDHQRGGVFRGLVQAARDASQGSVICVMANDRARDAHVHGDGWTHVGTPVTRTATARPYPAAEEYAVRRIERFADRHTRLWDGFVAAAPGVRAVRRDAAHLNWRFVHNPWYEYEAFEFARGADTVGYLVAKSFRSPATGETSGDLVDMAWRREDRDAPAAILRHGLAHFHARGVSEVNTWLETNADIDHIAASMGFRETGQSRQFCLRPLTSDAGDATDRSNWFLTMADAEIY